jgi:hypothetical protein
MVISYLAEIPDSTTFKVYPGTTVRRSEPGGGFGKQFEAGQEGLNLIGRLSDHQRDVCAEYYLSRSRRPPYFALAECPEDIGSIQGFTAKWGLLTSKGVIPPGWRPLIGAPNSPWRGDKQDFLMDVTGWISLKQRFSLWLEAAQQKDSKGRAELLGLFKTEGLFSFDAGTITLGLTWKSSAWVPQIKTDSLYAAFTAMLWLDISARDRMLLCCENSECRRLFITEKTNKKFCDSVCASQVAKRRWWRAHGARWRRQRSKGR